MVLDVTLTTSLAELGQILQNQLKFMLEEVSCFKYSNILEILITFWSTL